MSRDLAAFETEFQIREAAFAFLNSLETRLGGIVRYEDVSQFEYMGERISLLDPQRGIRKPRQLQAALSIRTVHSTDPHARPYADDIGTDGYLRYKWRGTDPNHPENRALRDAMSLRLPLIWFQGVGPGTYVPIYPVWLVAEEGWQHEFVVALDEAQLHEWDDRGLRRVAEESAQSGCVRIMSSRFARTCWRRPMVRSSRMPFRGFTVRGSMSRCPQWRGRTHGFWKSDTRGSFGPDEARRGSKPFVGPRSRLPSR